MSRAMTVTVWAYTGPEETEWAVTALVHPGCRATRTDPADGGEVELLTAKRDGTEMDFDDLRDIYGITQEQVDKLTEDAFERATDAWHEAQCARADYEYDRSREGL